MHLYRDLSILSKDVVVTHLVLLLFVTMNLNKMLRLNVKLWNWSALMGYNFVLCDRLILNISQTGRHSASL